MNNRPVGGCSSETLSHPINVNNNIVIIILKISQRAVLFILAAMRT
jgi:hypothetical protein